MIIYHYILALVFCLMATVLHAHEIRTATPFKDQLRLNTDFTMYHTKTAYIDAQTLFSKCQYKDKLDAGICLGYLAGAYDVLYSTGHTSRAPLFCLPQKETVKITWWRDAYVAYYTHLQQQSATPDVKAAYLFETILTRGLKCKGNSPEPMTTHYIAPTEFITLESSTHSYMKINTLKMYCTSEKKEDLSFCHGVLSGIYDVLYSHHHPKRYKMICTPNDAPLPIEQLRAVFLNEAQKFTNIAFLKGVRAARIVEVALRKDHPCD